MFGDDVGEISDHWLKSVGGSAVSVPEPSSVALAALGLLAIVAIGRRRSYYA